MTEGDLQNQLPDPVDLKQRSILNAIVPLSKLLLKQVKQYYSIKIKYRIQSLNISSSRAYCLLLLMFHAHDVAQNN